MGVVATAARETAAAVLSCRGTATRGARARGVRREMAERDAMVWMEDVMRMRRKVCSDVMSSVRTVGLALALALGWAGLVGWGKHWLRAANPGWARQCGSGGSQARRSHPSRARLPSHSLTPPLGIAERAVRQPARFRIRVT